MRGAWSRETNRTGGQNRKNVLSINFDHSIKKALITIVLALKLLYSMYTESSDQRYKRAHVEALKNHPTPKPVSVQFILSTCQRNNRWQH